MLDAVLWQHGVGVEVARGFELRVRREVGLQGLAQQVLVAVRPERVGCGVSAMLPVRMKSYALEHRQACEALLLGRPEILERHSSGEWHYLMRIVVPDVANDERFLMRELLNHPNVATSASHFALSQVGYTTAIPV